VQSNEYMNMFLKQVPLSSVKGTGPDGRILKADIEDYLGILFSPLIASLRLIDLILYFFACKLSVP
jgi:hypothetical protein